MRRTLVLLVSCASTAAAQPAKPPMTLDDLLAIRTLTTVAPSPSGRWVATVVQRGMGEPPGYYPYPMFGNDRGDIWLTSRDSTWNVTRGAAAHAGYWNPVWSPTGDRIAVLSTEGADNVRVFLIDAATGARRRLTTRGVDTRAAIGPDAGDGSPLRWLDTDRLLVSLLPPDVAPREFIQRRQTPATATDAWRRAHTGRVPTVSVVSTDSASMPAARPSALAVVDAATGRVRSLFEGPFLDMATSHGGARVALALPGSEGGRVLVIDTRSAERSMLVTGLAIESLRWAPAGVLLAFGRVAGSPRDDWWTLDSAGRTKKNVTDAIPGTVARNVVIRGREILVVADGRLWRASLDSAPPVGVPVEAEATVTSIAWPTHRSGVAAPHWIALATRLQGERRTLAFNVETGASVILTPPEGARLAAMDETRGDVFHLAELATGTFLWRTPLTQGAAGITDTVLTLNSHLGSRATSRRMLLRYRSIAGDSLRAVALLPANAQRGRRYPMVTWVYPGVVVPDTTSPALDFWLRKNHAHPDNLHLLAAHGYVVLIPSMPEGGIPRDPLLELPNGVLPAVDAAIAAGIADSARVAVMGQSAGGFATFGLTTQTNRFAAAVAIAGFTNFVSLYGTFDGESRYSDDAHRITLRRSRFFSEGEVHGLGAPPWEDIDRYVRNSPITHVARVQTPTLIIHGDIDYVPIQQSEEFFTALLRLGRRAEFARYWGESHGATDATANARDRWERVLAWLERWM